ncbi:MAG: asparagine synthase [Desulfovibrionaceae bacterium]|nr:MAG: asparagine synthase [Desulfovibrionaceae bacterium]
MCGIVGFTGPSDPAIIRAMCRTITHRGPDDEGYFDHPQVSLGMRRLAIVDLSGGRQPIANEDGSVVTVFNGEIYNHAEMRRSLEESGHTFATHHSDTETIVHAYEQHEDLWPEKTRTNGMFGLAIWDQTRQRLLLYRDRMGKKPLYWAPIPSGIAFASEIKSLLKHPEVSTEWDFQALYHYFGLKNVSAPRTAYRQIRQLQPGHYLVWTPGGGLEAPRPYWSLDFSPGGCAPPSEDEAAAHILNLLTDSVRLRMDCDVSYGAYLSGGMDSSAVASLMARFQSKPVKTFCLGYADLEGGQQAGKSQDILFSRMMAKRLGTDHHEHIITAHDFLSGFQGVMEAFDEPFSGTVSTYFLSEYMRRHITVAVSGDGADELFGSYLAHRLAFPVQAWLGLKARGITRFEDLNSAQRDSLTPFSNPEQLAFLDRVAVPSLAGWRAGLDVFSHAERRALLDPEFLDAAGQEVGRNPYEAIERDLTAHDALNRSLETDQRELLPNQVLPFVDRLSMAHSIEVRCPFLDHRIVEYVNRLPGSYKIQGTSTKHILRKALVGLLPPELINRPKEGFVQPVYTWMRGPLKAFAVEAMNSLPPTLVKRETVDRLLAGFMAGDQSLNAKAWSLVCFASWQGHTK